MAWDIESHSKAFDVRGLISLSQTHEDKISNLGFLYIVDVVVIQAH